MSAFLKAHGTAQTPLCDQWLQAGSRLLDPGRTGFPRRPRMQAGDRLVLYASGWRCIFGIAEVTGEPELAGAASPRWPWTVAVELLVVVPLLSNAPPVEAIGVAPRSMSQQSHIRLEERHLALALEALAGVGR
ncbi:MAG: hypothetical protein QOE11_3225 [Solirubrobacteraceae bacterium]|nr:hypothetical protein [Solirubrobacteraceae bacterium]